MPRPRKGARIYRRAGRAGWYAYLNREQKDIALGDVDEATALARLAELVARAGVPLELARGDKMIADVFVETRERATTANTPKTAYELHLNLSRVLAYLEGKGVATTRQVTRQVVEDYKTARRRFKLDGGRKAGVSAARINRELDGWRRAMRVAVEQGAAEAEVLDAFEHLREPRPEPHARGLSRRELDAFFAEVDDPRFGALWRVTLGTGMRDEEVWHMERGDVRAASIVVTPKPGWSTKGYRYREIPASAATVAAAKELLAARAEGWRPAQRWVWEQMQRTARRAKVPAFSMHDLRRAFASHMLDAGHKLADISRWLGHADVLTTMRYLRIVTEAMPDPKKLPW